MATPILHYRLARPYSQFASVFDLTVGVPFFRLTVRAFETIVGQYGIEFRNAADVGCGTGLFACYLNRRWGVPVFAVDRSSAMLRVAARRCRGSSVCFLKQDIRCLLLPCAVDLITANFDTVNHLLCNSDLALAFRRIHRNLLPGGHFLFDVVTHLKPLNGARLYVEALPAPGRQVLRVIRWNPRRRMISILLIQRFPALSSQATEFHMERAYSPWEVGRGLMDAGFVIRGVHDAITLLPAARDSKRLLVVAFRPPRKHCD